MSSNLLQFVSQYSLYSGCIICISGIIGNAISILLFTQLKLYRNNRSAFYLTVEAISNFFNLYVYLSITILTSIYGNDATGRSSVWCKFRYILTQTFQLIASYIICLAAIDQFFSTKYPVHVRQMCTMKLARYFTFVIICFSILHSILFGCYIDIHPVLGCMVSNPVWLQYSTYFFYPVVGGFLPIIIVSFFSMLAYRNVRRIVRRQIPIVRRRLDQQMTAIVLVRIIVFVCLVLPYITYRIYVINFPPSEIKPMEYAIIRLIQALCLSTLTLNYMISFYVFVILSSRFRRQVKLVLIKKCWLQWKSCCCSRHNQIIPESEETCNVNVEVQEKN